MFIRDKLSLSQESGGPGPVESGETDKLSLSQESGGLGPVESGETNTQLSWVSCVLSLATVCLGWTWDLSS